MTHKAEKSRRRDKAKGYALVEILTALAVTALICGFLFAGLNWSARAAKESRKLQQRERADAVGGLIRRLIEGAVPEFEMSKEGMLAISFEGDAHSLRLVTTAPAAVETPGLYRTRLRAERRDEGTDLILDYVVLRRAEPDDDRDPFEAATSVVLLENADAMELRYFGRPNADAEAVWVPIWRIGPGLPQLVSVSIDYAPEDHRSDATIIVSPHHSRTQ